MEIKQLLYKIENIAKQSEELSALKGENFNVFQIFKLESDENQMHSRFINTLINPNGCHGRGAVFLNLFLNTLNIPLYFENIDVVNTKVEHSIGEVKIDGMNSSGGRIDIFIWDSKKSISIENKINAGDQEKQIVRYCNYQKESNTVFYLNLIGTEPDGDYSKGKYKSDKDERIKNPDFYCISYSETILDWLDKCQKEASDFPIIRETIKQYIITIKRLTNQLTNQKMSEDINKLIIENYKSAKIVANNIEKAKITLVDDFLIDLKNILKNNLGDNWIVEKDDIKKKWSGIKVSHKNWSPKSAITLQGQSQFWKDLTILGLPSSEKTEIRKKLELSSNRSEIKKIKTDYPKKSKAWFFYRPIFNFGNDNHFTKLLSKEQKIEFIESVSSEIIELAKKIEKHLKIELS